MRTMVVFHLPGGALLYCDAAELPFMPGPRSIYQFDGKEYEVERLRDTLDRNSDGSRKRPTAVLFDLLLSVEPVGTDPLAIAAMLARLRPINEATESVTTGGLFIKRTQPIAKMLQDADCLMLVTMRLLGALPHVDEAARSAVINAIESLFVLSQTK